MNTVRVAQGRMAGRRLSGGVVRFAGVPYAALVRFRAPAPPPSWDGVRPALDFGPTAPQPAPHELWSVPGVDGRVIFGGWQRGAEYLNLNVWTPEPGGRDLPVMVFVHGGGFSGGAGSLPLYDGTAFAARGVVLVTLNYRLGVEGFVPVRGGDSNVGLRDVLAALRWLHDNVTAFGGDPANVTLFGESAGASTAELLMSSPAARRLIRRVISQSAGVSVLDAAYGTRVASRFADVLGVPATRDAFAALPPERLVAAQISVARDPSLIDLSGLGRSAVRVNGNTQYTPHVDGDLVPGHPAAADDVGVDLLSGTNRDEMNVYLGPSGVMAATTESSLRAAIATVHPSPDDVMRAYRAALPGASPGEVLSAVLSDHDYRVETRAIADTRAARGGAVFGYEFGWRSPVGCIGAGHVVELGFVFDTLDVPGLATLVGDAPPRELAALMQQAWVDFATTGDPGWARYEPDTPRIRRIDVHPAEIPDPFTPVRPAWAAGPGSIGLS